MDADKSRDRFTWEPGQKPAAMQTWFLNTLSDIRLSRGALRTAGILMFGFNATTGACWQRKTKMAESAGVSVSTIKQGLAKLEATGHILRVQEPIRGRAMRVIYPVLNPEIEEQERRARRGGVPKGVSPQQRATENAARKAGEVRTESVAYALDEAHLTPEASPEPVPARIGETVSDMAVPASSDASDRQHSVDPKPQVSRSVRGETHPPGGIPYWKIELSLMQQGFRMGGRRRLTDDEIREGSQAWADGEFDLWAERVTGEGPRHRPFTWTEGQSGGRPSTLSPSIQEKSERIIPDPIPEMRIRTERSVTGCSHAGCRLPARFRCLLTEDLLCIRHRGGGLYEVEIEAD